MPDISMCKNIECLKRLDCYRFMATPSCYQSYADFKPDADGNCEYFWNIN